MMNYAPGCNLIELEGNDVAGSVRARHAFGYPPPADDVCVLDWVPAQWNPWARNARR
ncbi:hypothetical protein BSF38_01373 [Paludisphaera borealis]|uniref:Uncharacterized protein n=1 Tax=Paludisphaera borealis TaxID=1387353 RepID=A0A1U7CLV0_9BACT|nr:hypothetical protein BSF38_01373 [Paludisphaera borealis]